MLAQDAQQKEDAFHAKMRQRDQEWQTKLETVRGELRTQAEEELRRRDAESAEARSREIKDLEVQLRKSVEEKHAGILADSKKREQDLVARLAWQTEACQKAEKERDEAKQLAFEKRRQVHDLNNKLGQVSLLLGGAANGNGNGNGNTTHLVAATVSRNS
jgi:membrane protein involved in colicin uptake